MFATTIRSPSLHGQRGAALFVGLIMLILLTLLGISAMQITILQERMAGNFLVQHQAFENAEKGLLANQAKVQQVTTSLDAYNKVVTIVPTVGSTVPWQPWLTGVQTTGADYIEPRFCGPGCPTIVQFSTDPERVPNFFVIGRVDMDSSKTSTAAVQSIYVF